MVHVSTYLKRLRFPKELLQSPIAKYFTNLRLIILIVLGITVFGITSFTSLPRNLFPDVQIPQVIVTTVIPGAGPGDVESLVTVPIEEAVRGAEGVKKVTSSSSDSVSTVIVEFNTNVELDQAKSDITSAVDSVTSLPDSALDPNVLKIDLQKTPIWTFVITGNTDEASLYRFANKLRQDLIDLPNIESVNISGAKEKEVQIVIRPDAILEFNLNPQQLIGAVKSGLSSFPSGSVDTSGSTFALTIDTSINSVDDIRNIKLNISGTIISLGDIADVVEISKPDQFPVYVGEDGKSYPAITFDVFRVTTTDITVAQKEAEQRIEEVIASQNSDIRVLDIVNYAEMISEQFDELGKDLVETILLVATVLFLFLGLRQASVALVATPLTFFITFIVMDLTGISLNFLSVFALLLSLGLLVDDTIVVVSAITAYYRSGKFTPLESGLLVFRDFITAITTTTATTIWAFLPILLAGGLIGLFIKPIPIVVSTTLAASFFVAIFITLPFMIFLLKPNMPKRVVYLLRVVAFAILVLALFALFPDNGLEIIQIAVFIALLGTAFILRDSIKKYLKGVSWLGVSNKRKYKVRKYFDSGVISFQSIEASYSNAIHKILNSKTRRRQIIAMVVIFSVFSYLLVPLGFVKSEFFPKADSDTLSVSVELPSGTNLTTSTNEALRLLSNLSDTADTNYVLLNIGSGYNPFGGGVPNENIFNFTLVFDDERDSTSTEIAQALRKEFKNYNKGVFSVNEETGGPPAGEDIQLNLFGSDLATLSEYADKTIAYLKTHPGVVNPDKSIKEGTSKIVFVPDEQKVTQAGLSTDQAGFWLRLFATGLEIDTIKLDEGVSHDITLRMGSGAPKVEEISNINIPTPAGNVPIGSLGKLVLEPNPTLITREDGKRVISVTAGVGSGYTIPQVNQDLEKFASDELDLPSGYSWSVGGVNEQNQESVGDIYKAMLVSILLIIITMVLQFKSFRRALIVILVIPLAISGVFIVFAITQTALSFPALIGVLALFGIVVKNSILIIDRILANINTGMEFKESIADAASSRLEPIALTSITAIVGLIPITLSDPLWRGLGGAIIAGLTFSGTIMLFFIPVVYYMVFNPSRKRRTSS